MRWYHKFWQLRDANKVFCIPVSVFRPFADLVMLMVHQHRWCVVQVCLCRCNFQKIQKKSMSNLQQKCVVVSFQPVSTVARQGNTNHVYCMLHFCCRPISLICWCRIFMYFSCMGFTICSFALWFCSFKVRSDFSTWVLLSNHTALIYGPSA